MARFEAVLVQPLVDDALVVGHRVVAFGEVLGVLGAHQQHGPVLAVAGGLGGRGGRGEGEDPRDGARERADRHRQQGIAGIGGHGIRISLTARAVHGCERQCGRPFWENGLPRAQ